MTPAPTPEDDADGERRGIQSIEVGGRLLKAAAAHGQALPLKALAEAAGMGAAKAHPYLVSFCKLGLMAQDPASGWYGLGPLATQMGLIGLQQVDPLRVAIQGLDALAAELGHTVAIAVWGSEGPTIVRTAASPAAVHVTMRHGTVVSLHDTASGPLFAAWRPVAEVKAALAAARQRPAASADLAGRGTRTRRAPAWAAFSAGFADIRARGLHRSVGGIVEGVSALAAPVFDAQGQMVLALTAIGPSGAFDADWEGPLAQALRHRAGEINAKIGGRVPAAGG